MLRLKRVAIATFILCGLLASVQGLNDGRLSHSDRWASREDTQTELCDRTPVVITNPQFTGNSGQFPLHPLGWRVKSAPDGQSKYRFGPGEYFKFGAAGATQDVVQQNVTVLPGCTYLISYTLEFQDPRGKPDKNQFYPSVNGEPLLDSGKNSLNVINHSQGSVSYSGIFTASSNNAQLCFGGSNLSVFTVFRLESIQTV